MRFYSILFLCISFSFSSIISSAEIDSNPLINPIPIHEAFVSPVRDIVPLEVIATPPPETLAERKAVSPTEQLPQKAPDNSNIAPSRRLPPKPRRNGPYIPLGHRFRQQQQRQQSARERPDPEWQRPQATLPRIRWPGVGHTSSQEQVQRQREMQQDRRFHLEPKQNQERFQHGPRPEAQPRQMQLHDRAIPQPRVNRSPSTL